MKAWSVRLLTSRYALVLYESHRNPLTLVLKANLTYLGYRLKPTRQTAALKRNNSHKDIVVLYGLTRHPLRSSFLCNTGCQPQRAAAIVP